MNFTKQSIPLQVTSLFSRLFLDYINASDNIRGYYANHIYKKDFEAYLKANTFNHVNRTVLVEVLRNQLKKTMNASVVSQNNITALAQPNTFTVSTGHQLCLFTGPLYFIYKIISTINLCKTLQAQFPDKQFVPVYWMASEDHDFEEINHAFVFNKKISWNSEQKGAVGDFNTSELNTTIGELETILGSSDNAKEFIELMKAAYLKHANLADATRYMANELFGEYGLVVIDGDDAAFKQLFKQEFTEDVFNTTSFNTVNKTNETLSKNYAIQVTPRPINVFYKEKNIRERIEKQSEDKYSVLNTDISFTKKELEYLIETTPEKLSPNVVLRPLYQQKILPNIAYVGGPGELAYWLEYKNMFEQYQIPFPLLMPRQFALVIDKNTQQKLQKLHLTNTDVFKDGEQLVKEFIKTQQGDISLSTTKEQLESIYKALAETITHIDKTLVGTTEAEKQKALNGISIIEQKINKAFKQKSETEINQLWSIKEKLFPKDLPQERHDNMSMYYAKYGKSFINDLMETLTYDLESFSYTLLIEN